MRPPLSGGPRKFYTFGYQSHTVPSMIKILKANGIDLIVDIRQNPVSRKAGFAKSHLEIELPRHGIEYLHYPPLGTPPFIRAIYLELGNVRLALKKYSSYLERRRACLRSLIRSVWPRRFCLLCLEKDHNFCHRGVIASKLVEMIQFQPIHLT